MGKVDIPKTKFEFQGNDEPRDGKEKASLSPILLSSSDNEEANEDLSLKIVEKASLMRASSNSIIDEDRRDSVVGAGKLSSSLQLCEVLAGPIGVHGSEVIVLSDMEDLEKNVIKNVKKTKDGDFEIKQRTVIFIKEDAEEVEAIDYVGSVKPKTTEIADNMVFRKLLRGPRYFDPPESRWGNCYNCGEEGHIAVNCTSLKRKKPCFVCGSLDHNAKSCSKVQDCFICKRGGHRAKDCPEKHNSRHSASLRICLKCGDVGHDMFLCNNGYSHGDLEDIQCYVCKRFGHLCCINSYHTLQRETSCYKCGQLGHTGLACARLRGEAADTGSPMSCYKCGEEGHFARECGSFSKANADRESHISCYRCGEEGHFARECMSFSKVNADRGSPVSCYTCGEEGHFSRECASFSKVEADMLPPLSCYKCPKVRTRNRELQAPTPTVNREGKNYLGFQPALTGSPSSCYKCGEEGHFARECISSSKFGKRKCELSTPARRFHREDRGSKHRDKKAKYDKRDTSLPRKLKHRGGWMMEDPGDFSHRKSKKDSWSALVTPPSKIHRTSLNAGGYTSPQSSARMKKIQRGTSMSQGSSKASKHRFSSSSFGNSSSNGQRKRGYERW